MDTATAEILRIEKLLPAPRAQVFQFITRHDNLLKWWGPEGMTLPEENLDFTRTGPWFSVMTGSDGKRHKCSGEVTEITPPERISLTWGWHDEDDRRGPESLVRIGLEEAGEATRLTLLHTGLTDTDTRSSHTSGWKSSLGRLERLFA